MAEFRAWRDAPKLGETDAGWLACKYVDGHQSGGATSGHPTRTHALAAIGAPRKGSYAVEAECRDANAHGKFEMRWFREVPLICMSPEAAIMALHEDHNLSINRIRTITQEQDQ